MAPPVDKSSVPPESSRPLRKSASAVSKPPPLSNPAMPPGISRVQAKRENRLAIASRVMRERGVLSTRLQDVADALNIAHSAIYHHFHSASHMIEEILTWNLNLRTSHLASVSGTTALDQLIDFVARDLIEDRDKKVGIPALIALPEENRQRVQAARDELVLGVANLVQAGIDEGSIRPVHALTVSNFIVHNVESYVRFDMDMPGRVRRAPLAEIANKLTSILRFGLLENRAVLPPPSHAFTPGEELLGFNPADDPEIARYEAILRVATRQFNQDSGHATVPKIAAELGVSKTVIYQYAEDKTDLLYLCYERAANVMAMCYRIAWEQAENPLDETFISHNSLYSFHAGEAGPFTNLDALQYLKPHHLRIIRLKNRGNSITSIKRRERAIEAGYLRSDINPELVQPMMGRGIYNLPSWYDESYPLSIDQVSSQDLSLLYQGLAALD